MNPSATQVLLAEHAHIRAIVDPAIEAAGELSRRGPAAYGPARASFLAMADLLEGDLARHAAKEDEILFPAIERALGSAQGPTAVMRDEHRRIHSGGEQFRRGLAGLSDEPSAEAALSLAEGLLDLGGLIDVHFKKEEDILFPMAEAQLTQEELSTLGARLMAYPG